MALITECAASLMAHVSRRIAEVENASMGTPCWLFTGPLRPDGYARISILNKMKYLHIYVYETLVGSKPDKLDLDHLCRVRHCCNPEHLEPVTRQINSSRGLTGINQSEKTHCPRRHPYSEENTRIVAGPRRQCRACGRIAAREYAKRQRLLQEAGG